MKDYPAIKLSVLFVLGILSEKFLRMEFAIAAIIVAAAVLVYYLTRRGHNRLLSFGLQLLVLFSIISAANIITQLNNTDYKLLPESIYRVNNLKVKGEVTNVDLIRNDELNLNIRLQGGTIADSLQAGGINLLCKIKDDSRKLSKLYNLISIGNIIEADGNYIKGRERRNPGEFDYNKYLREKGISGIIYIYDAGKLNIKDHKTLMFSNLIFKIRKAIDGQIKSVYNEETAGFLRGILLADRSGISYNEKENFINSGVIHILAVSGLHVGYILLVFAFIFGRFNIYLKSILTLTGLVAFLLITGVPPSAFRATVMAIVLITALLLNRSTNLLNSVAIAALIILIINPHELFNAGFQLSFSAVISIALIYPVFRDKISSMNMRSSLLRKLLLFIGVSLAAQIGTLPFTIYYFGKVSLIALLTNLLVIPAAGAIVGIGILSLFLSVVLPPLAPYFTIVNEMIVRLVYTVIHFTGGSSFSFLRVHDFSLSNILAYYAFLLLLFYYFGKFQKGTAKFCLVVLCLACYWILGTLGSEELLPDNKLSVMMIDVGQGDAFLVKLPGGQSALVDAGEANYSFDNGERVILPLMNYLGIEKIDYGFVSHVDLDHYGGFVSLIHKDKIREIYKPVIDSSLDKDLRFENYLTEYKTNVNHYHKEIIKAGNARIYILNTNERKGLSSNNNSGILKIVYGKTAFLFTGDLETQGEKYYDSYYGSFLNSNVLKVGHHGSKTSSSDDFLRNVMPGISLISAGIQNKFHHPSGITLQKLKSIGSKIYRTDISGAILLQSDGNSIKKIDWKEL